MSRLPKTVQRLRALIPRNALELSTEVLRQRLTERQSASGRNGRKLTTMAQALSIGLMKGRFGFDIVPRPAASHLKIAWSDPTALNRRVPGHA